MKILFIVPYPPSLVRVRPYNFIRYLTKRGNQITVCTLYTNKAEKNEAENFKKHCHTVISAPISKWQSIRKSLYALPTTTPLQAVYSWQKKFAEEIESVCKPLGNQNPFDVIHVEHLRGSKYGTHLQRVFQNSSVTIPIVWDSVDCISLLFRLASSENKNLLRNWITQLELKRTANYESYLLQNFRQVCVTSKIDQQALENLANPDDERAEISVIPNGVDLEYFSPGQNENRKKNTLIVSGKMSYHANVNMVLHLVKHILPSVWDQNPDVKLQIVGKDPAREILALADNPAISVTGTIDDIRPYLQQATIALTPITYGVGIQNKVLEAMACGTPIVSTSKAVSALDVRVGQDVLIADNPTQFALEVNDLLQNPQKRTQIGMSGRKYVEKHHDWFNIAGQLEQIYLRAKL